jgi:hypothetical protein
VIPDTKNNLPAMATVSKAIRRGMEREAMELACELMMSRRGVEVNCGPWTL